MSRQPRHDYRGALHHVMLRGVAGTPIFLDDEDRSTFLRMLIVALDRTGARLFAWALMDNHVHLVTGTGKGPLAVTMHHLATRYAMYFNKRYNRSGHLFQNRYKSIPIEDDVYLFDAICYVLRNPLKAGIVLDEAALASHAWTAYPALLGRSTFPRLEVDYVLRMLDDSPARARTLLRSRIAGVCPREGASALAGLEKESASLPIAWGSLKFVEGARAVLLPRSPRRPVAAVPSREGTLEHLIGKVCNHFGADPDRVRMGFSGRRESKARAVISYLGRATLGLKQKELASALGVGESTISMCLKKAGSLAKESGLECLGVPSADGRRVAGPLGAEIED